MPDVPCYTDEDIDTRIQEYCTNPRGVRGRLAKLENASADTQEGILEGFTRLKAQFETLEKRIAALEKGKS